MQSTHIRVPVDIKKKLEDRAAGRPLYLMLQDDFLHEPEPIEALRVSILKRLDEVNDKLDLLVKAIGVNDTMIIPYLSELIASIADKIMEPSEFENIEAHARKSAQDNFERIKSSYES